MAALGMYFKKQELGKEVADLRGEIEGENLKVQDLVVLENQIASEFLNSNSKLILSNRSPLKLSRQKESVPWQRSE